MTTQGVRIVHPDGNATPVSVAYIGTEPREVHGEIYIVELYAIVGTFLADCDRIEADQMPDVCSFVAMHVGQR